MKKKFKENLILIFTIVLSCLLGGQHAMGTSIEVKPGMPTNITIKIDAPLDQQFYSAGGNGDMDAISAILDQGYNPVEGDWKRLHHVMLGKLMLTDESAVVKLVLDKGFDLNIQDEKNQTFLHLCAESGSPASATLLIEKGLDVNAVDNEGVTPLHLAAEKGSTEMIQLLIENGADVNIQDHLGEIPLHRMIGFGGPLKETMDQITFLLEKGADPMITNKEGKSPMDLTVDRHNKKTKALFEKYLSE